ncbi:Putative methyltransferase [Seminavis robusta]|uniref:Methyltransferase n=1 Tax=Seminavis robusta TaxID=568900 RepID=A0A9N8EEZ3_9STRA|nr:Putative methyltransferase [Seminavis robusta]|eukprot:Sro980_g227360.1 Putative methyltransferase (329) ;mRNA; f:10516-11502
MVGISCLYRYCNKRPTCTSSATTIITNRVFAVRKLHQAANIDSIPPPPTIITDEGIMVHQADPSTTGNGLGLVWGSVLWPSGVSLAKYLSWRGCGFIRSKRILELGCGTGIVGLTLAKNLQAQHVTLTDSESALWPVLRRSIDANHIPQDSVSIHELDWRDPSTFLLTTNKSNTQQQRQPVDLVVAADVLYSGMDKLFARALAAHLPSLSETGNDDDATNTAEAIIACPYRSDSPLMGFFEASMRLGLEFDRLENNQGQAVGSYHGVDCASAFDGSQFVPLETKHQLQHVAGQPTFSSVNVKQVQIFRARRVHGTATEAASIRRVGRI